VIWRASKIRVYFDIDGKYTFQVVSLETLRLEWVDEQGFDKPHTPLPRHPGTPAMSGVTQHSKQINRDAAPVPADSMSCRLSFRLPEKFQHKLCHNLEASQLKRNHGNQDSQNW
jgi:hypothetical protein